MTDSALATRDDNQLRVFSLGGFDDAQRMAKALAASSLVPTIYQGQTGLANCLIALEISGRMGISPLVVMQNMVPIHGKPTWSSQFLIGTVNACGRFSPLRYVFDNEDAPTSCYAEAKDLASGEVLRGEKITIAMAKAEGWWGKNGSKWPSMTGQMLRYRAASWWAKVFCPEISLGLATQEEAIDVEPVAVTEVPAASPAVPAPLVHAVVEPTVEPTPDPSPAPSEPQTYDPEPSTTPAPQPAPRARRVSTAPAPAAETAEVIPGLDD